MEPFHIFFRGASPFASVNKPLSSWILRWPLRRSRSPKLSNLRTRTSRIRTPHASRPFIRHFSQKYARSSESTSTPHHGNSEPQSLSARWKKLSREYGYTVIGVYLALTVADFPFCFLAVKYIGEERVSHAEHVVVGGVKRGIQRVFPGLFQERGSEKAQPEGNGAEKSTAESESGATIWTQLALAFVIHKSFIFIRVPLTAAITPKVVKTLRGWGWDIGRRRPKQK